MQGGLTGTIDGSQPAATRLAKGVTTITTGHTWAVTALDPKDINNIIESAGRHIQVF
jgi:hypothetical protein